MESSSDEMHLTTNPSTGEAIAKVPYATIEEVSAAVNAASLAFPKWSNVPITERAKYLFRMKDSFERHLEELAAVNSINHGKTIVESRGDVRRAIDNIDSAIAVAFTLSKGDAIDNIANEIDEVMIKESHMS